MKLLVSIVILLSSGRAFADAKTDAKAHVDKATAAHAAGKYADALAELDAAYQLDPQPGLLYAIAQVHVKLDECAKAIPLYEQFLASNPEAKPTAAAKEAIAACKTRLAAIEPAPAPEAAPAPKPAPPPEPVSVTPPPPPAPERPATGHWYADPLGGVLVGAGVAAGVTGVILYRGATADIDAAKTADTYGASEDLVERASGKRTLAAIVGAGSVALVTAGVIRYVLAGGRSERRTVAITPTGHGAAVTWSGRF